MSQTVIVRTLTSENEQLREVIKNSERKIAALEAENEQLRRTVDFHEKFGVSEREEKAYGILVAMIQSQPVGYTDRSQVDAKKWARKAYEFADALDSEGGKA